MPRQDKGFTLIELLVTIALLAIVATFAVPAFQGLVESNRLSTTTNSLLTAFKTARSEAVKRGGPVTLTADGGSYASGWCIYQGVAGTSCANANAALIRQFEGRGEGVSINANGDTAVEFDGQGRLTVPAGNNVAIAVEAAGRTSNICIGLSGRTEVSNGGC